MELHHIFNREYDDFISKIGRAVPKEKRLIDEHYNTFRSFAKINVKAPINMFLNTSHPFAKQIFDKDSQFFMNLTSLSDGLAENGMSLGVLSKHWVELSEKSQEAMWQYLRNLLILSWQWVGINTFDKPLIKRLIDESPQWLPQDNRNFPDISKTLQAKYGQ